MVIMATQQPHYIALKPLKIGDEVRQPGEVVPEANEWRNVHTWVSQGYLAPVAGPDAFRDLGEERTQLTLQEPLF